MERSVLLPHPLGKGENELGIADSEIDAIDGKRSRAVARQGGFEMPSSSMKVIVTRAISPQASPRQHGRPQGCREYLNTSGRSASHTALVMTTGGAMARPPSPTL